MQQQIATNETEWEKKNKVDASNVFNVFLFVFSYLITVFDQKRVNLVCILGGMMFSAVASPQEGFGFNLNWGWPFLCGVYMFSHRLK